MFQEHLCVRYSYGAANHFLLTTMAFVGCKVLELHLRSAG